jgi:hypothetical protein
MSSSGKAGKEGIETGGQTEKVFLELTERFRSATDPEEVERLGNEMGRMVFGK